MFVCQSCIEQKLPKYTYPENLETQFCEKCNSETLHIEYEVFEKKLFEVFGKNFISLDDLPERAGAFFYGSDEDEVDSFEEIILNLELDEKLEIRLIEDAPFDGLYALYNDNLQEYEGCDAELEWNKIESDFKHDFRFFNEDLKNFLDNIFSYLTNDGKLKDEIITTVEESSILYRARSFDSFSELIKEIDLKREMDIEEQKDELCRKIKEKFGLVPPYLASDQRMTPYGISTLYLSNEKLACVAEIRALVGQFVGVAQFSNRQALNLLDLNRLAKGLYPDCLSESYLQDLDIYIFFKKLISIISKPKLTSGKFDYLVSQYFFEYLRVKFCSQISGISLKSVQMPDANNIILFPELTKSGVDRSKDSGDNPIHFLWDDDSLYGLSISRVKSISITTEIDLSSHPRHKMHSKWM